MLKPQSQAVPEIDWTPDGNHCDTHCQAETTEIASLIRNCKSSRQPWLVICCFPSDPQITTISHTDLGKREKLVVLIFIKLKFSHQGK